MRGILAAPLVLLIAVALGVAAGSCGSDDEPQPATTTAPPDDTTARHDRGTQREAREGRDARPRNHRAHRDGGHRSVRGAVRAAVAESEFARLEGEQRDVARVVRAYVDALDARRGERACSLFAPGALAGVDLPRERGDCGESLTASIGYRDPRGFPVFASSRVARIPAVVVDGSSARVTATTVTRFKGAREPSVEDDLVYLREAEGRWLIAKPSASLYRAIGVGDIPPSVLAPP